MRIDRDVAGRQVHAVAVVVREGDRTLVEHADEARLPALVRALRPSLGVGGGDEDHVAGLDERLVVGVDERAREESLLDPVGEPAGLVAILERTVAVVVGAHPGIMAASSRIST